MKRIFAISAIVLFSTVMFAGGINKNPNTSSGIIIKDAADGLFNVYYKGDESASVKISIFDSKENKVFSETLQRAKGFLRPYNLSNLPNGAYTFVIDDGARVQTERVINGGANEVKLFNVTKLEADDKFLLTASGKGREVVTINIFDLAEKLLYSETRSIKNAIARVYDLSHLKNKVAFEIVHANGSSERFAF